MKGGVLTLVTDTQCCHGGMIRSLIVTWGHGSVKFPTNTKNGGYCDLNSVPKTLRTYVVLNYEFNMPFYHHLARRSNAGVPVASGHGVVTCGVTGWEDLGRYRQHRGTGRMCRPIEKKKSVNKKINCITV